MRYRKTNPDSPTPTPNNSPKNRKEVKKVKERTIADALDSVRVWRQLYDQYDNKGKRIYNLESAAKVVGISKKTLDDYNYQIKLAESFKFDFQTHRHEKIGVMRSFIKNMQTKGEKVLPPTQSITNYHSNPNIPNFIDTDLFWADSDE